jgi:hypothetical protein
MKKKYVDKYLHDLAMLGKRICTLPHEMQPNFWGTPYNLRLEEHNIQHNFNICSTTASFRALVNRKEKKTWQNWCHKSPVCP